MRSAFHDYARCPDEFVVQAGHRSGREQASFFDWESLTLFGTRAVNPAGTPAEESGVPFDVTEVADNLRLERYCGTHSGPGRQGSAWERAATHTYYAARPLLPVSVRKHAQRLALRDWRNLRFPSWPVDVTVDRLMRAVFRRLLDESGLREMPFIWFWPEGHTAAAILTHDVETAQGRDFSVALMEMEAAHAMTSAFEVVPEDRYEVPASYLDEIRARGCEVCIHGLNHDGRLFQTEAIFRTRAQRINEYGRRFGASGFRSPVMYRRTEWFDGLDFSFDMSLPNVAHLDPQRGGCCTVMPYFIGRLVELPLTTTQDYQLLHILREPTLDLWKRQCELIQAQHGLISFIIHPDYAISPQAQDLYRRLLDHIERLRDEQGVWVALPRDVDHWWRQRSRMRVERAGESWTVVGEGSERARLAFACTNGDDVAFRVVAQKVAPPFRTHLDRRVGASPRRRRHRLGEPELT